MLLDGLYEVLEKSQNKVVVKLNNKNHPIFKAHFPTQPILPGFTYFDIASQIFDINITNIKKSKFLKPALPDQILVFERSNNKFKILSNNEQIANFVL